MSDITQAVTKEEIRQRLGNILQIRDLLLGDKLEEYEYRFERMEKKISELAAKFGDFQIETDTRFMQIQTSFQEEIDTSNNSIEARFKYLNTNTQAEINKFQQELSLASKKSSQQLESLQYSVNRQITFVNDELSHTKNTILTDFQNLKKLILDKLNEKTAELQGEKIGKNELADILFDVCLKIKDSDFAPEPKESSKNYLNGSTLSPDETEKQN
jgi:hypothetical protein